jgi:hypothetical protein
MVSSAFKIGNYKIPLTGPYVSFVGKIYSKPKQEDDDCVIGINVNEYNNFSFTNKGRINLKIQVVYDVGSDSRFRKLTPKLEIGKAIFISGLLDLGDSELPFVIAKEIDLPEDSAVKDYPSINSQSLFSRTQKFKSNKYIIKKEESPDNVGKDVELINDQYNDNDDNKEMSENKRKKGNKNSQPLKKTKVTTRSQKQNDDLT